MPPLPSSEELQKLSVLELQNLSAQRNLPTSGSKPKLIAGLNVQRSMVAEAEDKHIKGPAKKGPDLGDVN